MSPKLCWRAASLRACTTTVLLAGLVWLPRPSAAQTANGPLQQVVGGPGLDIDASVSPDGKSIVYASSRGGDLELWMRGIEGGALYQLTSAVDHSADRYPLLLPDGNTIVFQSDRVDRTRNIWTLNLRNRALAQLTTFTDGGASHPSLSPDAQTICFTRTSAAGAVSIWLMTADGGNLREVSPGVDCTWTPSGKLVLARGSGGDPPARYDIWMMDQDGAHAVTVSAANHTWSRSPAVSPDGRWLAYTVYPSMFTGDIREVPGGFEIDPRVRTSIWLVSLAQPTTPPREVVAQDAFNSYAGWTRDRRLLFTSTRTGSADIWSVAATQPSR